MISSVMTEEESAVTGACLINASTATNGTRQAKGQNMRRTHKGLMYGVVPCYFDFTNRECPGVEGRFIGCEALLIFCDLVFEITCYLVTLARPEYEPLFPIKLTGTLDWDGEEIGG